MNKEELEFRNEVEKITVPVPPKTVEAAISRARAMAKSLRAYRKPELTSTAAEKVGQCASELSESMACYEVVPVLMLTRVPCECAREFENFADDCQACLDRQEEENIGKAEQLVRLSSRVRAASHPSLGRVTEAVRRITSGEVTKQDIMKNYNNIEQKARGDRSLATLVDWKRLQTMHPGITRSSKLMELDVDAIKSLLVCLKGAVK